MGADKTAQAFPTETDKTVQTFVAHSPEDLSIEVIINLADIDIDAPEKQPEMAFGNLVKRRSEVKSSTLTPERKKELTKAKDNELNTRNPDGRIDDDAIGSGDKGGRQS